MFLPKEILKEKLVRLVAEDVGQGDVTSALLVGEGTAEAKLIAKEAGVAAGIEEAQVLLEAFGLNFEAYVKDGAEIKPKQVLMKIYGDARAILSVERTLLNLVSRMSGIATTTRKLVENVRKAGYKTRIACTRKTAPGLLYFDKKAVLVGGGDPHRFHLDDMVLIKDNHISVVGSIKMAVKIAKERASLSKKIEVEVADVKDALEAAEAGADIIMLDNFPPKKIKETITALKKAGYFGKVLLEASGGITVDNVLDYASEGVDIISLGEITHSVKALDISLELTSFKSQG
ncbi:MAG: carboxylating nicotinate-nucleotide diphosphorylase [Candidatus Bathyarchaeia archaeon]